MGDFPEDHPVNLVGGLLLTDYSFGIAQANRAWPGANKAMFYPFIVDKPVTVFQMSYVNGTTPVANADVGIYDIRGNRLVSSGSVAGGSANVINIVDVADTLLAPGYYFSAMVTDGVTSILGYNPAVAVLASTGVCEMATAFPLPTPATLVRATSAFVPVLSAQLRVTM